jgi:hypothetical protein
MQKAKVINRVRHVGEPIRHRISLQTQNPEANNRQH